MSHTISMLMMAFLRYAADSAIFVAFLILYSRSLHLQHSSSPHIEIRVNALSTVN